MSFRKDSSKECSATPISHAIVLQLRARAAARLRPDEALFLFTPANILGFVGVPLAPSDRLVCGLMNAAGQTILVCPAFEAPEPGSLPENTSVLTWTEHEDPYQLVARAASQLGVARETILVDERCWVDARARLAAALSGATLQNDAGVIATARLIKSPDEIDAIVAACRHVGSIYREIQSRIHAGIAEIELASAAIAALPNGQSLRTLPLLQSGPNAAIPHRPTSTRALADGDLVIVDYYVPRSGYWGDMTRTFAVGQPDDDARRAYQAVRAAHRAGIAACRPGVACQDVDRAARQVIENAGLGPYFIHRLGHGLGLDGHERPYLVRGNAETLEPGMCVTIEPGVYVPGQFGIRIEDVILITDDGYRILSEGVPVDVSETLRN